MLPLHLREKGRGEREKRHTAPSPGGREGCRKNLKGKEEKGKCYLEPCAVSDPERGKKRKGRPQPKKGGGLPLGGEGGGGERVVDTPPGRGPPRSFKEKKEKVCGNGLKGGERNLKGRIDFWNAD